MSDLKHKLTHKQQAFTDYYLANGNNATQAAIAAGYSKHTAKQQGSRLLSNVDISKQIDQFTSRMAEKSEITRDYLNTRLRFTVDQDPVGPPSHADLRGAADTLARLNGLMVDKSEISGEITFEGFKKRMNAAIDVSPSRDRLQGLGKQG